MLLQACLNGARRPDAHPRLPTEPSTLAREGRAAVAAGAEALHVHVRGPDGAESYAPASVAATLAALRDAVAVPVGVSTGAWVVPDPAERHALVAAWTVLPDFASVNLHEPGAPDLARLLLDRGVGIEAGLWNAASARVLVDAGLAGDCLRMLLEPLDPDVAGARRTVTELRTVLDDVAPATARLLHGFGETVWPVLGWAAELGYASRIGLEDTLVMPDGSPAADNGALVAAGRRIFAR